MKSKFWQSLKAWQSIVLLAACLIIAASIFNHFSAPAIQIKGQLSKADLDEILAVAMDQKARDFHLPTHHSSLKPGGTANETEGFSLRWVDVQTNGNVIVWFTPSGGWRRWGYELKKETRKWKVQRETFE